MNVLLCTSYPPRPFDLDPAIPHWRELATITTATHRKYCEQHGYDYFADCSDVRARLRSAWKTDTPQGYFPLIGMIRFRLLAHFLTEEACGKKYDVVAWTDADTVVTNYDYDLTQHFQDVNVLEGAPGDLVVPVDVNGLHPTVLIAKNSVGMRGYMWALTSAGETMFLAHQWNDNVSQRFFLQTPPYRHLVQWRSAQELCAMPPGVYPIPRDVRALYEWTPKSWTLHLSALSIEKRIEIATEYVEELGLL